MTQNREIPSKHGHLDSGMFNFFFAVEIVAFQKALISDRNFCPHRIIRSLSIYIHVKTQKYVITNVKCVISHKGTHGFSQPTKTGFDKRGSQVCQPTKIFKYQEKKWAVNTQIFKYKEKTKYSNIKKTVGSDPTCSNINMCLDSNSLAQIHCHHNHVWQKIKQCTNW